MGSRVMEKRQRSPVVTKVIALATIPLTAGGVSGTSGVRARNVLAKCIDTDPSSAKRLMVANLAVLEQRARHSNVQEFAMNPPIVPGKSGLSGVLATRTVARE
mmetsp:Transcript_16701/g.45226  ORF Transcript_16701/g.45226 Transcript_16701/m.45226 type:complete len:103 (+) Transcript_16701:4048-4356(+)